MADIIRLRQVGQNDAAIKTLNLDDWVDGSTGYKTHNLMLRPAPPNITAHTSDVGETRLVQVSDGDRQAEVELSIHGSTDNDLLNKVADLRRWLDEATRNELDNDNHPVVLEVGLENATYQTRHRIRTGWLDDGDGYFGGDLRTARTRKVMLYLHLEPYGTAGLSGSTRKITMRNDLTSSPHFVEDTDDDGLADGWAKTASGSLTTSIETLTAYLIGGSSQKAVATAADMYVNSPIVDTGSSVIATGYIWIKVSTGTVRVQLYNSTDAAAIEAKNIDSTDSGSVSDQSTTDVLGNTWYRVVVTGGFDAGDDIRITTNSHGAAATWFLDGAYLEVGNDNDPPDGWMSACNIDNRNDIQSTSAATENYLNYIDVWGIPGDAPALASFRHETTTASGGVTWFGKEEDGRISAADISNWYEDESFNDPATWVSTANAAYSNGNYKLHTSTGSASTILATLTGDAAREFCRIPRRVFAIGQANAAGTLQFSAQVYGNVVGFTKTNTAEALASTASRVPTDLGLFNMVSLIPDESNDPANEPTLALRLTVSLANGQTYGFDALQFIPVGGSPPEFMICDLQDDFSTVGDVHWIDSELDAFIFEGVRNMHLGTMPTIKPGKTMTRFIGMRAATAGTRGLSDAHEVTIVVTPRTTQMIGTL